MKAFKKLLLLGAALTACLGLSATAISCGTKKPNAPNASSGNDGENGAYVYRVSLQNATGFGFKGATVKLVKGDTVVASKQTNASGNATFTEEDDIKLDKYDVVIENAPAGYALPEEKIQTTNVAGIPTVVTVTPTGLLGGEIEAGKLYQLGDVMHDFSMTLANGSSYTLSEILEEKDMVLINFWATWCGPCNSEFPAMNQAAIAYEDTVSVLAISTTDSNKDALDHMAKSGYEKFNIATVSEDQTASKLHAAFGVSGIPHSVMIDRYGVVVFNELGSMPSVSSFTTQFDKFVGDDYQPTVVGKVEEDEIGGGAGADKIKPTETPPDVNALKNALVSEDADRFSFRYQEEADVYPGDKEYDEYNWPWLISEDNAYIKASNKNVDNSYAILYSTITVAANDVLVFDYKIGSEENADILYVMLDGEIIKQYSGNHATNWNKSYAYVFTADQVGKHELAFVFLKDSATMANEDIAYISDLHLESVSDLETVTDEISIFRHAATVKNDAQGAVTQFKNYVDVVLGEDEYYHVGSATGPVLYANMMTATPWNETSLWALAYSDYVVGDGMNYKSAIEEFAWEATQVTTVNGYTPVTEDLRYLLEAAVRNVSIGEKFQGKNEGNKEYLDYHEDEWLELCVYWERYGVNKNVQPKDPMAGITFTGAIPLTSYDAGETPVANKVSVPYKINPRGFKYEFTPTKSGAYRVYSTGDKDPIAFLVDGDRKTQLGYYDNKIFADENDDNFEFYWYFEAGKDARNRDNTYYLLFTTYLDNLAEYNVYVEYLGESYTYLENAAVGPYSANLNTFELFLPDAIEYEYSDLAESGDGYYHHKKADGSLGGIIYLDLNRPTAHFTTASLGAICNDALFGKKEDGVTPKYEVEDRALYIKEKEHDYTDDFYDLWDQATSKAESDPTYGMMPVTQEIFGWLNDVVRSEKYEGIENSWLLLCYYYRTLSAND